MLYFRVSLCTGSWPCWDTSDTSEKNVKGKHCSNSFCRSVSGKKVYSAVTWKWFFGNFECFSRPQALAELVSKQHRWHHVCAWQGSPENKYKIKLRHTVTVKVPAKSTANYGSTGFYSTIFISNTTSHLAQDFDVLLNRWLRLTIPPGPPPLYAWKGQIINGDKNAHIFSSLLLHLIFRRH